MDQVIAQLITACSNQCFSFISMQGLILCLAGHYSWAYAIPYVNDLITDIQSVIRLFGDDCHIYWPINSPTDHPLLQEDLNTLTNWATKWQIQFNTSIYVPAIVHKHYKQSSYSMGDKLFKICNQHGFR